MQDILHRERSSGFLAIRLSKRSPTLLLIGVTILLAFSGLANLVNFGYPVLVFVISGILYRRRYEAYLAFVWWQWLLSPEVRRLVDFQIGFQSISPVMLSPYLAGLFSILGVLKYARRLKRKDTIYFVLIIFSIFYAYMVGLVKNGILSSTYGMLSFLIPLAIGLEVILRRERYRDIANQMQETFLWSLTILSFYGLYQYFFMPPWDAYWMGATAKILNSIGVPEAGKVRVFGPLNAPGPYAMVLMSLLLYVPSMKKGKGLRPIGFILGFIAFGLSLVRSAWGGWAIGLAYYLWMSKRSINVHILRALFVIIIAFLMSATLISASLMSVSIPMVSQHLEKRFDTLSDLAQDTSFKARVKFYEDLGPTLMNYPVGAGLGGAGLATKLSSNNHALQHYDFDSGIMYIPYTYGWLGAILFFGGLLGIFFSVLDVSRKANDLFTTTAVAVFLGGVAQLLFFNVLSGVSGLVIWMAAGLALAYRHILLNGDYGA